MATTKIPAELVAVNAIQGTLIADNAITAVHIATNAVSGTLIADNALTAVHIATDAVTPLQIQADAVTAAKLATNAVVTASIVAGSVTTTELGADAVTNAKIANDAIDSEHYTDGSIDAAHLADDAVTIAKMAALPRGKIIYGDASGAPAALALGTNGQTLKSDGTDIAWADNSVDGAVVFNESGADVDFRVESNNNANMLFVDGGVDSVGIGTNQPSSTYKLDVVGAVRSAGNAPSFNLREDDASSQHWQIGSYSGSLAFRDVTGGAYPMTIEAGADANSLYIDDAGNVGIGTTAPVTEFHVRTGNSTSNYNAGGGFDLLENTTAASRHATLFLDADNGNWSTSSDGAYFYIQKWGAAGKVDFIQQDAADFNFKTGGSHTRLHIDGSNGKVGIGTADPNQLLTLGSSDGSQVLSFTTSAYLGDNAVIGNIEFSTHAADSSYGQLANIYALKTGSNTNSGALTFWTKQSGGRAERVRISEAGNVGIGDTAPNDKLQVVGTITSQHNIVSNSTYDLFAARSSRTVDDYGGLDKQYMKMYLATPGSGTTGESNAHAYGDLRFAFVDGSDTTLHDRVTFRYGGNVGIGTTNPLYTLHVSGAGHQRLLVEKTDAGGDADLQFRSQDDSTQWILFNDTDTGNNSGVIKYVHSTNKMHFRTNDVDDRLVISSDGNVGIGDSSPETILHVKGGTGGTGGWNQNTMLEATYPVLIFNSNNTKWSGIAYDYSTAMRFFINADSKDVTDTTAAMTILNGGNVGIGTTAPAGKLHISGNSDTSDADCQLIIDDIDSSAGSRVPSIQFRSNTGGSVTNQGRIRATDTQGMIISGSSGQGDDLVITSSGVGIGICPTTKNAGHFIVTSTQDNGGSVIRNTTMQQYKDVFSTHTSSAVLPYWHIKTNFKCSNSIMFVARVRGYEYGNSGHIVDISRSGYAYTGGGGSIINSQTKNNGSSSGTLTTYIADDDYVVFKYASPSSSYYNGYTFDMEMYSPTGYTWDFEVLAQILNNVSGDHY